MFAFFMSRHIHTRFVSYKSIMIERKEKNSMLERIILHRDICVCVYILSEKKNEEEKKKMGIRCTLTTDKRTYLTDEFSYVGKSHD